MPTAHETMILNSYEHKGWDSPDEAGTSGLSAFTSSPGPSGLSGSTLSTQWNDAANSQEGRNWSPPVAQELEQLHFPHECTDTDSQGTTSDGNDVIVLSPEVMDTDLHKLSHQRKLRCDRGKHKHQSIKSDYVNVSEPVISPSEPGPNSCPSYITVSSCGSSESRSQCDVILVSSEGAGSPEIRQVPTKIKIKERNQNLERCTLHEERSSRSQCPLRKTSNSRIKVRSESRDSRKSPLRKHSRKSSLKSGGKYRKSRSSSRTVTRSARSRTRSTKSRSPVATPSRSRDLRSRSRECSSETVKVDDTRPSSPTEEEMKHEILQLEKKIAEDTKRLTQLHIKQEKRRLNSIVANSPNVLNTEDSGTDDHSR